MAGNSPKVDYSSANNSTLKSLFTSLQSETFETYQLTKRLSYFANNLNTMESQNETQSNIPSKEPESITDYLWQEIFKLRKSNSELLIISNHFEKVIGELRVGS